MARPHIEFVQTQNVGWTDMPDGSRAKVLSSDETSTDATLIVRYPAGWSSDAFAPDAPAEEYFVLDGVILTDGEECGQHSYGFIPAGSGLGRRRTDGGATLLIFRHAQGDADTLAGVAEPIRIDTMRMPWDVSTYDPVLSYMQLARKILRLGPNDSGRTFLLTGLPHGLPPRGELRSERHRHCEEMFMLHGEMFAPEGRMCPGAYFYRPPGIVHGPHVSCTGFLQIMRSPGANRIVTEWSDEYHPLPIDNPYSPVMPAGTPDSWTRPFDRQHQY